MKTKRLFISLTLGLGLTLALLWLLSGQSEVVLAQAGSGIIRVAPPPTGNDAPNCGSETNPCRTVHYAVDQAQAGEEIRVASGVYTGVQNVPSLNTGTFTATQMVVITKTLTLRGGYTTTNWTTPYPIAQPTTLDAQGQGRVLYITGDISPTVEGLRITGGDAAGLGGAAGGNDAGGGVYGVSATATLSNNRVFGNTADYGGGLYLNASDATLSGNTVTSNTADSDGGGLYLEDSHATLNSDTVSGNTADYGGGLYLDTSDATLSSNTVTSNTASFRGGGLYLEDSDGASLSGNTITSNTASFRGGGLSLNGSDATLSGNTIASNTASFRGGGLYLEDSAATLSENTISDNTASFRGGGLYLKDSADATLSGNTVISNTADYAGGLYLEDSAATLSGNTISDNTASSGGGLYLDASAATLSGNTVSDNTANYNGGGLYLDASGATLSGNTVTSNAADSGGGLYLEWSNATLTNNVVADNQANIAGSGLYMWASSPRLLHTTIARNSGGDGSGVVVDAMQIVGYQTAALTNTILVSHTVGITVTDGNTAILESTLWGSGAWANGADTGGAGTIITGTRNYWDDPAFVDPGAGDYHISPGSAAIDVGVDAGVTVDIDGESRPTGTYPDLGVDEFPAALSVTKEADPDPVQAGAQLTYTLSVTNTGNVNLTATVTDTLPDQVSPTGVLTWTPTLTAPGGVWTEQFTVTVQMGYSGTLTNVVEVTTEEGATGVYTETSQALVTPMLEVIKEADPDPVQAGAQLTYTLSVTNTGNVTLTATVTDTLPDQVSPTGVLTWTPTLTAPDGVWTEQFTVTVQMGYSGTLTNVVEVTTEEGATGTDTAIVTVEEAIEGLTATNDSPTPLGSTTTLTATITEGSNVVYTWAFGHDGATGSGAVVAHIYPDVGVYTAIVTASNSVSVLTATTTVTITDALIEGLVANNDSPTVLGQVTTLTATITRGSNVAYTWALGDGDTGSGAVVAHTYPATGTYTAVVTASNSVNVVPATTTVTIIEALELYLPIIFKDYAPPPEPSTATPTSTSPPPTATPTSTSPPPTATPTPTSPSPTGPDLVVTDISVVPNPPEAGQSAMVYVTVRNQGNQAVPYGNNFYVDFYVDHEPAPLLRGDIDWGVQGSWFGTGESRTLDGSYTFTEGTHQLWGQADTDNTVVETNENNNVLGPVILDVTSLGGGEVPTGPVIIPTPGAGSPRPTPSPAP